MRRYLAVFAAFLLLAVQPVIAQDFIHYVKFGAASVSGPDTVVPVLTWCTEYAAPGSTSATCDPAPYKPAVSCTASGPANWSGAKSSSGTTSLPAITANATYALSCAWNDDTVIRATWTNPTQNTNGTPLTDLDSIVLATLKGAGALTSACTPPVRCDVIKPPTPTSTVLTGFTPGAWRVAAFAKNAGGSFSLASNEVAVRLLPAESIAKSVTITVFAVPDVVSGLGAH